MKTLTPAIAIFASGTIASAQSPDPAGDWKLSSFDLGYTKAADGSMVFGNSELATGDLAIDSDGSFAAPDINGRWFFSNDFLYAVDEEVTVIPITRNLDTFVFSDNEVSALGGGTVFEQVRIEAGVRLPDADFAIADVAGTWNILRQTSISFLDSNGPISGYNAVTHARDTLQLETDGTFTLTEITTTDPGGTDGVISGTWSVVDRKIRLSAGGETLDLANLSSGLDTHVDFREETFVNGSNTNFDRKVEFALREPSSLVPADVVGKWGYVVFTVDVDDETPDFQQDFRGAVYETGTLNLLSDGTGTLKPIVGNEPPLDIETLTWQIDGKNILATDSDGMAFTFHLSAQKDFGVALNIEDGPGTDTDAYDLVTLTRLPDAPGFAGIAPRADFSAQPEIFLDTQAGLYYQLQRSTNFSQWENVGSPVSGDGTEQSVTDTAPPTGRGFYRWSIVAPPS